VIFTCAQWYRSDTDISHKTLVVDRYNIVSETDLRAGVDRLAAYGKKLPKETIVEPLKNAGKGRG